MTDEAVWKTIPQYPNFNPRRHVYVARTGLGDGWELQTRNITEELYNDMLSAVTDEEESVEFDEWFNHLDVYDHKTEDYIASFDPTTWQWKPRWTYIPRKTED